MALKHPTTDEAIIIKSEPNFDEALALPGMPRSEGFVMACRLLALVPDDFRAALTVRNLKSAGKRGTYVPSPSAEIVPCFRPLILFAMASASMFGFAVCSRCRCRWSRPWRIGTRW